MTAGPPVPARVAGEVDKNCYEPVSCDGGDPSSGPGVDCLVCDLGAVVVVTALDAALVAAVFLFLVTAVLVWVLR